MSGVSPLHFGYSAFYVPVGFALQYDATSIFSLGLNATWMPQVFSIVSIDPLDEAFWTLTRTLANVHIEVPFGFMLDDAKRYAIFLTPFFEYWQDGHSLAVTTTGIPLDLPGNTYYFAGVDLNFSFRF